MSMELHQLRYLVAVVDEGSFTQRPSGRTSASPG